MGDDTTRMAWLRIGGLFVLSRQEVHRGGLPIDRALRVLEYHLCGTVNTRWTHNEAGTHTQSVHQGHIHKHAPTCIKHTHTVDTAHTCAA